MEASRRDAPRSYRTIPAAAAAPEQLAHPGSAPPHTHPAFLRRTSTLASLLVFALVAAFVIGRQRAPVARHIPITLHAPAAYSAPAHRRYVGGTRVLPRALGAIRAPRTSMHVRPAHVQPFMPRPVAHAHADAETADFSLDERVATRQCGKGRTCRARLTVVKDGNRVSIKAGYLVYGNAGTIVNLYATVKRNLRKTTSAQTNAWAAKLLAGVSANLAEVECAVTQSDVAAAIATAQDTVVTCPRTDDARCDVLLPVGECDLTPPAPPAATPDPCTEYVRSGPTTPDLATLQQYCANAVFQYNRVGTSLPFCTTECPSRPDVPHTVYADFFVQANRGSSATKSQCLSQAFASVYNTLYPNVLPCDAAPPTMEDEGVLLAPVATTDDNNVPQTILDATAANGCPFTYAYFFKDLPSLDDVIKDSCASG